MIKYPDGKKNNYQVLENVKTNRKKSRLGVAFEQAVNESNQHYLQKKIAIIHKKPTPVQIVKVDFPSRNRARVTEAYYKTPSTTDYNGLYKGFYIDFEAKSCTTKSFPFSHIFTHQIEHLKSIDALGGISFLLIEFTLFQEIFLLPTKKLLLCFELSKSGGRKSIPYNYFQAHAYLIKPSYTPRVPYLTAVDQLIEQMKK